MFPPVQENASLDSATAPEIEAGLESDQKPPPDLDQLNQIFLNLGLNDRTIRSFSAAAKLRILELSETANTSTTKESPNHLIRKIKSVKVKTKVLDELKVHITGETPSWTMEFLEGGGITHLLQLIESVLMKPKKTPMSWSLIVNVIKILIKLSSYTNGSTLILDHYSILANIVQQCLCNQHHVPNNLNSSFIYLPSALKASPTRSPLILRQYILLLFAQLGEIGATEWLAVGSLLSGKPQFEKDRKFTSIREALSEIDFSVWLTEFEGILYERSKIWNKTNTKAADVFNTLADGTYRWQTIVQSRVETTPEYEVVQLLQTHFNLLMSLHRSAPCKNEIERYEFNNYLIEKTRLNAIFEKLKLCDCPSIKEIHSRYKSYLAELKGSMVIPMTVVGDPSHGLNSKQLRRRPNISLRENSSTTPTELF